VEGSGINVGPVQVVGDYWGMEVMSQPFLTSAVGGGERPTSPWYSPLERTPITIEEEARQATDPICPFCRTGKSLAVP